MHEGLTLVNSATCVRGSMLVLKNRTASTVFPGKRRFPEINEKNILPRLKMSDIGLKGLTLCKISGSM